LIWLLKGKKQDPHQSHGDRARMIRSVWQRAVAVSILLSGVSGLVIGLIQLRRIHYVPFTFSLFCQVLVVVLSGRFCMVIPFGQESYEGYKADPNRRTALGTNASH
jgi:hypothetical protein